MRDRLVVATLATVAAALLFAAKGVLAKLAYARGIDATTLIGLRMGLALPVFIALFVRAERAATRPATWRETIATVALGILGYHVASWLDFLGLQRIDAAVERVVLYLYPTLVVIAAIARGRQAVGLRVIAALGLTYAGIALTWSGQARVGGADAAGVALVAASAFAYAGFLIGAEGLMARLGGQRFMALAMCGACATTVAHAGAAHVAAQRPWSAIDATTWAIAAALAYACTVVPTMLVAVGMRGLGSARFSVVSGIGPVGTAFMAWAVVAERPTALAWLGMAMTIIGGALVGSGKRSGGTTTPRDTAPVTDARAEMDVRGPGVTGNASTIAPEARH